MAFRANWLTGHWTMSEAGKKGQLVKISTTTENQMDLCDTVGDIPHAVLFSDHAAGDLVDAHEIVGASLLEILCDGAATRGLFIVPNAAGNGAAGTTGFIIGQVAQAFADDDLVEVWANPHYIKA